MNTSFDINYILLQIFIFLAIAIYLFRKCSKYNQKAPFDDIGVIWIFVLFLYSAAPALSFYFQDGVYLTWLSGRLFSLQPTISQTMDLLNISICYALGFTVVYIGLRKKIKPLVFSKIDIISDKVLISASVLFLISKISVTLLYFSGLIGAADTYIEEYRVINEAPTLVKQFLKIVGASGNICYLIVVVGLFQRWPRTRFAVLILLLITFISFNPDGSRTSIVMNLFAMIVSWHVYVKKIKTWIWVLFCTVSLMVFTVLGALRGVEEITNDKVSDSFKGLGEFEAIWSNGVQMIQEKSKNNLTVPFDVRFSEFWQFIPSQLLPFEKSSLSVWYVKKYYPSFQEAGGGWAFGSVAQSALGGGYMEALFRGMALALLYHIIFKFYRNRPQVWWSYPFYLQILIFSYQSIRDTTFSQLTEIFQILLPTIVTVWVVSLVFEWRTNQTAESRLI
jgi:hypothetical protein